MGWARSMSEKLVGLLAALIAWFSCYLRAILRGTPQLQSKNTMELTFSKVDFHCKDNNSAHHTSDITSKELIVRRGQTFLLTIHLEQAFDPNNALLLLSALTGSHSSEERGTQALFGIPEQRVERSEAAIAVWRAELHHSSKHGVGNVVLEVTPHTAAPVGKYLLSLKKGEKDVALGELVVLFNPWCSDDWVFLSDEKQCQEYVMNEQGMIFKGSWRYIQSMAWDYSQFEENMVDICLKLLDVNPKYKRDPADDVSARCNPIYVGRVVSAMINSVGDRGVLEGCWDGSYYDGFSPSHWKGSLDILQMWHGKDCHPVKYGQCWVFAAVMCTVMRCLGIPCRVVTNFNSAHDTDNSLTIDIYHSKHGTEPLYSPDSVWNFHVWVEAWMRRPDLQEDGSYDGWQVLDPTPQEMSQGVYCCGPASVTAIHQGDTNLKYDVPFVFAEVNADVIDWLVKDDGSKAKLLSDTKRVGKNISTKSVGSNKRKNITNSYKYKEGTEKERITFDHAITRDYSRDGHRVKPEDEGEDEESENDEDYEPELGNRAEDEGNSNDTNEPQQIHMFFLTNSEQVNGQDIKQSLLIYSHDSVDRLLSVTISVQAMLYNGVPMGEIQRQQKELTLEVTQEQEIPVVIPFSVYGKHLLKCDSLKVTAVCTDKDNPELVNLQEIDVVPKDPPIITTVSGEARLGREMKVDVKFRNPLEETLTNLTLSMSGSGLLQHFEHRLPDLRPHNQVRILTTMVPYKTGEKTLLVDLDCSAFRDIKGRCTVTVTE